MDQAIGEIQRAQQLYQDLEARLQSQQKRLRSRWADPDDAGEIPLIEDIAPILELESRLAHLVRAASTAAPDVARTQALRTCFERLRTQIQRLLAISLENESILREARTVSHRLIQELNRGAKYIQSVRGPRETQPRFVDSQL